MCAVQVSLPGREKGTGGVMKLLIFFSKNNYYRAWALVRKLLLMGLIIVLMTPVLSELIDLVSLDGKPICGGPLSIQNCSSFTQVYRRRKG